jgi:uncharacterized membrane protein YhfC
MLMFTVILVIVIEFGLPFLLGWLIARRYGVSWKLFGVGVLTFIGSQLVRQPLLYLLTLAFQNGVLPEPPAAFVPTFNLLLGSYSAGLFEESARWVGYKLLKGRANWRGGGLMLGAGHGGIESMAVAVVTAAQGIPAITSGLLAVSGVSALDLLPGAAERAMAILLHITLSMIVLQVFTRRNWVWWLAAVLWHGTINAVVVSAAQSGFSVWQTEGVMALFTIVNIGLLAWLIRRSPKSPPASAGAAVDEAVVAAES